LTIDVEQIVLYREDRLELQALLAESYLVHLSQMIIQSFNVRESPHIVTESTGISYFKTDFFTDAHVSVDEACVLVNNAFTVLDYFL